MTKREEFLETLLDICEYWKDKHDGVYGAIFSTLVMLDGCSGFNNYNKVRIEGITNSYELHDDFCRLRNERAKGKNRG